MDDLKPKDWVFLVPEEGVETLILYAPLHKLAVRVTKQARDMLVPILDDKRGQETPETAQLLAFLNDRHLLTLPGKWRRSGAAATARDHKITMSLTNKCNLRCIYCYAATGKDFTTMSWEVAKAAIDGLIAETVAAGSKKFAITFHGGGEAMVEQKLLERCVLYIYEQAQAFGLTPQLSMVTNCTLITRQVADWLKQYFVGLTVSMDGPEDVQNHQRPKALREGSFSDLMEGLANLTAAGLNFSIRATVTDYGVSRMVEFVEFLAREVFPKGGSVHFEPMSLCGRAATRGLTTNPKAFLTNYLLAQAEGERLGIKVTCSLDAFRQEKKRFCGASTGTMFCVAPNGGVSACSRVTKPSDDGADLFFYAKYDSGASAFVVDETAMAKIVAHGALPKESCQSCFARWNCQGHCPIARYSYPEHHEEACTIVKELLTRALVAEVNKNQ